MKKKFEFSKIIIGFLVSTYFVVLALGIFVTIKLIVSDSMSSVNALIGLFSYVGGVNSISIPFYLHKSQQENLNKYPNVQTTNDYKTFDDIQQNDTEDNNVTGNETDAGISKDNPEEVNK